MPINPAILQPLPVDPAVGVLFAFPADQLRAASVERSPRRHPSRLLLPEETPAFQRLLHILQLLAGGFVAGVDLKRLQELRFGLCSLTLMRKTPA